MTISELAKELSVSRQTIYNRAAGAGIQIDDLCIATDGRRKILSAAGEDQLRGLFSARIEERQEKSIAPDPAVLADAQKEIAKLETEVARLREDLRKAEERANKSADQVSALIVTVQAATATAAALTQQQREPARGKGLFAWIKSRIRGQQAGPGASDASGSGAARGGSDADGSGGASEEE